MKHKITEAAKTLCALTRITIRIYQDGRKIEFFSASPYPASARDTFEPYQTQLEVLQNPINCITTPNRFLFGVIRFESFSMIFGPVRPTPVSRSAAAGIALRIDPSGEQQELLTERLIHCVNMSMHALLPLLASVYKMINFTGGEQETLYNRMLSFTQVLFYDDVSEDTVLHLETLEEIFDSMIENGDTEAMQEWFSQNAIANIYTSSSDDPLREARYSFIILATLASKAAAQGGVDRLATIEMLMSHLQFLERLNDPEDVYALQRKMAVQFTEKVRQIKSIPARSRLVENAMLYVRHHLSEPVSVSETAHSLSVSRGHLSRLFRAETGMTLSDYINETKVREAMRLLEDTDGSLAVISASLGFSSQAYFTRVFKKYTGYTPKEYRTLPSAPKN